MFDFYTADLYGKVRGLEAKVSDLENKINELQQKLLDIALDQSQLHYMTDDEQIKKLVEDVAC